MWYKNSANEYYNLDQFGALRITGNDNYHPIRGYLPGNPNSILIESACPSEEEAKKLLNALLTSTLPLLMWEHFRIVQGE